MRQGAGRYCYALALCRNDSVAHVDPTGAGSAGSPDDGIPKTTAPGVVPGGHSESPAGDPRIANLPARNKDVPGEASQSQRRGRDAAAFQPSPHDEFLDVVRFDDLVTLHRRPSVRSRLTLPSPPAEFGRPSSLSPPDLARELGSSIVPELQQFGDHTAFALLPLGGEAIIGRSPLHLKDDYSLVVGAKRLIDSRRLAPPDSTGSLFLIHTGHNLPVANLLLDSYQGSQAIHYVPVSLVADAKSGKAKYEGNFARVMAQLVSFGETSAALQRRNAADWPSCRNLIAAVDVHEDDATLSFSRLPDSAWMQQQGIERMFVLLEDKPGRIRTVGGGELKDWLKTIALPTKVFGIDTRI